MHGNCLTVGTPKTAKVAHRNGTLLPRSVVCFCFVDWYPHGNAYNRRIEAANPNMLLHCCTETQREGEKSLAKPQRPLISIKVARVYRERFVPMPVGLFLQRCQSLHSTVAPNEGPSTFGRQALREGTHLQRPEGAARQALAPDSSKVRKPIR